MLPIEFEGLLTVCAFRNHNHIVDSVNESDETLTHDGLVVNHHNFDLVVTHSSFFHQPLIGTSTRTSVPSPSRLSTFSEPPIRTARSCMPTRPKCLASPFFDSS